MDWKIVAVPEGRNAFDPGKEVNKGGIVIYLQHGNDQYKRQVVSAVAFDRKSTEFPRVSFKVQLKKELQKANDAVEILNALVTGDKETLL